jgi:hypothetical protein
MSGPDLTAVSAAFGRAAHVILDEPPYVLEDTLSIELADESIRRAAQLLTPDGRLVHRIMASEPGLAAPQDGRRTFGESPLPRRHWMRVGPQAPSRGAGVRFEAAERHVRRGLAEPPRPAKSDEFPVDVAAIRERHLGQPAPLVVWTVIAHSHDPSSDELSQGLLGLIAECLAILWGVDPSKPDDDLAPLMESSERIAIRDRDHASGVRRGLRERGEQESEDERCPAQGVPRLKATATGPRDAHRSVPGAV